MIVDFTDYKKDFLDKFIDSFNNNIFVKLTLSKYRGQEPDLENIYISYFKMKDDFGLQFRYKYKTKDTFNNLDLTEALNYLDDVLGSSFLTATLFTTKNDLVLEYSKKRKPRTFSRKASFSVVNFKDQNRIKTRFIDSKSDYFRVLGITTAKGEVKYDKFDIISQTNEFISVFDSLYTPSALKNKNEINVVVFGTKNNSLIFSLYNYLIPDKDKKFYLTCVEQRVNLVEQNNLLSSECKFFNLIFKENEISEFNTQNADIVIAFNACDTVADDVILKAVNANATILILTPCCHNYVQQNISIPEELSPIFKNKIYEEQIAAMITDGLRSLYLESKNYLTNVLNFPSSGHKLDNTMITAVRNNEISEDIVQANFEIEKIKIMFGLKDFYLDKF